MGDYMAFDTFDEGIAPGGMRSKTEIRTMICYLFNSVKEKMGKDLIVESIVADNLANYFETCAAFDDLIANENLMLSEVIDGVKTYELTENGKMIANQLDTILPFTVKKKAYECAIRLLAEQKKAKENKVEITQTENGYDVTCRISGGDVDLLSFTIYAPDKAQAKIIEKNFFDSPTTVYKVMLALMTKDKDNVGGALEELYGVLNN